MIVMAEETLKLIEAHEEAHPNSVLQGKLAGIKRQLAPLYRQENHRHNVRSLSSSTSTTDNANNPYLTHVLSGLGSPSSALKNVETEPSTSSAPHTSYLEQPVDYEIDDNSDLVNMFTSQETRVQGLLNGQNTAITADSGAQKNFITIKVS